MVLSASIPALKSKAKRLRRAAHVRLCEALDQVAAQEGYATWSLLVAKEAARESADLLDRLDPGDLVLLGARPGHGKTLCAVQLLISGLRRGQPGWFFALQNDAPDIDALFEFFGERRARFQAQFSFEHSDEICARYIIDKVTAAAGRAPTTIAAIAIIDHLQLLDQRRKAPELEQQMRDLRDFAKRTSCILVFISQIRSGFEQSGRLVRGHPAPRGLPCTQDIRLLDDLDLSLFDKFLFLREGRSTLLE